MNDNFLTIAGRKETADGVVNVRRPANDGAAGEKSPQPAKVRTGEIIQPKTCIRDWGRGMEYETAFSFSGLEETGGRGRRRSEVIDRRDLRSIPVVVAVEEPLDEVLGDISEHVLDRFVLDLGMGSRNRTLEDTNALWILVENCIDVLRLPQRILRGVRIKNASIMYGRECLTFLNQTSNEASRIGMNGTGF